MNLAASEHESDGDNEGSVARLTMLLRQIDHRPSARDDLYRMIEHRFRAMASKLMKGERSTHSLQPTILVDDAFLQLLSRPVDWVNREQFFCSAAKVMRRLLIDHARSRNTQKRGGGAVKEPLNEQLVLGFSCDAHKQIELDELAAKLELEHPETFKVFDLHYYGGWQLNEIAEDILGVSGSTVKRRWSMAKAFLRKELRDSEA